jgi:hypothetical protein
MKPYYRTFHTFHEPSSERRQSLGLDYLEKKDSWHTRPNTSWVRRKRTTDQPGMGYNVFKRRLHTEARPIDGHAL